jgi:transcriptional regulator with XRE-family HTH domain
MQLGDLIRQARRAKDLSQEELAEKLDVHHKTIGKWERNVASPRGKLPQLEQVLGVKLVNRPENVRVRVADPTTLSNAELTTALLAYTAELTRRLPPEALDGGPIDPELILRQGWSATRMSDLTGGQGESEANAP